MKHSTDRMIGTDIPSLHWDATQSSTKTVTPKDCGHHEVLTNGTWAHWWITKDVTFNTFSRLGHIESWVPQNIFPNTAKCQIWLCTNTFVNSPTSWPNQQQLQVQPIREDGSLSYSNQRLRISFIPLCQQRHCMQNKRWERKNKGNTHPHRSAYYGCPSDDAIEESNCKKSPEKIHCGFTRDWLETIPPGAYLWSVESILSHTVTRQSACPWW